MSFQDVRILYLHEMRSALRERSIVVHSILIPLFLYPVLLWVMLSALSFVKGQQERFVSRIALSGVPAAHGELRRELESDESIELVELPAAWQEALTEGDLDAVAELSPAAGDAAGLAENFRLRLSYDASKDRSALAHERLKEALESYREAWLERSGKELGMGPEAWERFRLESHNVASGRQMGAFILGLLGPLTMIIMIALGCFNPAIDATAGERERSTWETLMSTAASRASLVTAKYLYVATFGVLAGLLNLVALTVTLRAILGPLMGGDAAALEFEIPFAALPLMAFFAVLLALFLAAGMMIFAAFARTFKEGQSMVGPFYLLSILPVLFVQAPDLELTPKLALIPIANVALMFREAIAGVYQWPLIGLTLGVQLAVVGLCLALVRWVLSFEDVLIGSYSGSLGKFLKSRLARGGQPTGGAA